MSGNSQESRVRVDLTAVVIAVREGDPHVLTVDRLDEAAIALPSGPLQQGHRSLQAGLRNWVETQTQCRLGYVEQLYTFGDRIPSHLGSERPTEHHAISIAYLTLVPMPEDNVPVQGRWRPWYAFFPWEDRRSGEPASGLPMVEALRKWTTPTARPQDRAFVEPARLTFGLNGSPWDEERALERYEMLYEAELVPEAAADRRLEPKAGIKNLPGIPMFADHRRILATAISRLRAKIKYRPVLFELMPASFTLSALQKTAEALSGVPLHTQNFRRLVLQQGLVEETGEIAADTGGRPAKMMRFRREATLERPAPGVRVRATRRASYP
ncbi:MAG: hypothetical protein AAFY56_04790 [Pseudomonadota bacterium]